jgi:hypothetical protein
MLSAGQSFRRDTGTRLGVVGDLLLDDHGRHLEDHNDLNPSGIDRLIRPEAQLAADIERLILEAGAPSSRGVRSLAAARVGE